jgi:hypothetical protein
VENRARDTGGDNVGVIRLAGRDKGLGLFDTSLDEDTAVKAETLDNTAFKVRTEPPGGIGIVVNDRDRVTLIRKQLTYLRTNPSTTHDNDIHNRLPPFIYNRKMKAFQR